jgi:hypothetical protein
MSKFPCQSLLSSFVSEFRILNSALIVADRAQEVRAAWPTRIDAAARTHTPGRRARLETLSFHPFPSLALAALAKAEHRGATAAATSTASRATFAPSLSVSMHTATPLHLPPHLSTLTTEPATHGGHRVAIPPSSPSLTNQSSGRSRVGLIRPSVGW